MDLIAELFERHDRSRFELFAFSFGPVTQDAMRSRVMASFDRFVEVGACDVRKFVDAARTQKALTAGHAEAPQSSSISPSTSVASRRTRGPASSRRARRRCR